MPASTVICDGDHVTMSSCDVISSAGCMASCLPGQVACLGSVRVVRAMHSYEWHCITWEKFLGHYMYIAISAMYIAISAIYVVSTVPAVVAPSLHWRGGARGGGRPRGTALPHVGTTAKLRVHTCRGAPGDMLFCYVA